MNLSRAENTPAQGDTGRRHPTLIVPGLDDSGPGHWQSLWLERLPDAIKVEQADWSRPTLAEWMAELTAAVRRHPDSILVGHSLGCALIAHLAQLRGNRGVAGALLVAPAEVNRTGPAGHLLEGFGPMPLQRLPFPATVIASRNDPFVAYERSEAFARSWGARFVDAGDAGHINVASGHGNWPLGLAALDTLMREVSKRSSPEGRSTGFNDEALGHDPRGGRPR